MNANSYNMICNAASPDAFASLCQMLFQVAGQLFMVALVVPGSFPYGSSLVKTGLELVIVIPWNFRDVAAKQARVAH